MMVAPSRCASRLISMLELSAPTSPLSQPPDNNPPTTLKNFSPNLKSEIEIYFQLRYSLSWKESFLSGRKTPVTRTRRGWINFHGDFKEHSRDAPDRAKLFFRP